MRTVSVSDLNNQIKAILESTFERISVEGEVSNVTYHTSGHVYFSLKDENSSIKCVMFRGNVSRLKFRIERGMHLVCEGGVSVYTPRGDYQLNCFTAMPAGEGALAVAYEQLKKKLTAKGYFDEERKKPLPRLPKRIGIVTSATGAAIQDMLKVAGKRWNLLHITLYNTVVQGEASAPSIAANIARADKAGYDVIVIGRGGGSMEDLWAFNEEVVADAVFNAKTPVISAVGHEVDFVISDFIADKRAPTPSAAMELLLPDQVEVLHYIDTVMDRFDTALKTHLSKKSEQLNHLHKILRSHSMSAKVAMLQREAESIRRRMIEFRSFYMTRHQSRLQPLQNELKSRMNYFLTQKGHTLQVMMQRMQDADPTKKLLPHTAQVIRNGKGVDLNAVEKGEMFTLIDAKVRIEASAVKKEILE